MGSCFSKKTPSFPPNAATASQSVDPRKSCTSSISNNNLKVQKKKFSLFPSEEEEEEKEEAGEEMKFRKEVDQESLVKKEIFVIKHRKSHDRDKRSPPPPPSLPPPNTNPPLLVNKNNVPTAREPAAGVAAPAAAEMGVNHISNANGTVRTSSCTKEEVDAILIQCGILSRSNSTGAGKAASSSGRKYSGSKRSFDLDHNGADAADFQWKDDEDNQAAVAEARQHRQRHRHRRQSPSSSSHGRRRTPSREREQNSTSSGRRLSRSPARKRSETNTTTPTNATDNRPRPAKMLSVPAASLATDKSNNSIETQTQTASAIKRISVKRCSSPVPVNVGEVASAAAVVGSRTAASPRSRSPARANAAKGCNDNNQQQQQPSLSRSSSRKAEQSPYRRNPLTEIDQNSMPYSQPAASKASCVNNSSNRGAQPKTKEIDGQVAVKESVSFLDQKPKIEGNIKNFAQRTNCKGCNLGQLDNKDPEEQQQSVEKANGQTPITSNVVTTTVIPSGVDSLNPQALTRSRSARRSRDLNLNPETLLNPTSSYTALLLEDIQNFHQKNNPSFPVPPCVTKACSILEAVVDLNSTTSSNLSSTCSNDRRSHLPAANLAGKKISEAREPFLESEILTRDDLMEPSFHKYVTVRRGGTLYGGDMDGQESSGSNSFVDGSQQHWGLSASSWEPNSADSTDRWTSRSNTRDEDDDKRPPVFHKHTV